MSPTETLLNHLQTSPETIDFKDVIKTIDSDYNYQPTAFKNHNTFNSAGSNEGSCKIFAFAQLHQLKAEQTLALFGRFYREDVLQNPQGEDHANIRNFMQAGWKGIEFESQALSLK